MKSNAEHQQDHADFGQFTRKMGIADKSWREGSDHDASDQIANQRRQLEPRGDHTEHEGEPQADGEQRDQRRGVGHRAGGTFRASFAGGPL